jgi:4-hydroxybenzoate polyprenyltransferase
LLVIPALAAWLPFLDAGLAVLVGFVAFSLMASSVYLLNDVWDVQHDRAHPTKKTRALASGDLPMSLAVLLAPVLGLLALSLSWFYFGAPFTIVLGIYAAVTVAYSTLLKRIALIDLFALAGLYGIRIVAGAVAVSVPLSPWLISFSLFVFLSLALIKRVTELGESGEDEALVRGRGYLLSDAPMLSLFGVSSGFMAGVILSLYIEDPAIQSMYSTPALLWAVVPVWLYWISRAWLRTHRGMMNDDPVLFAITDRATYLAGALIVIAVFFAR